MPLTRAILACVQCDELLQHLFILPSTAKSGQCLLSYSQIWPLLSLSAEVWTTTLPPGLRLALLHPLGATCTAFSFDQRNLKMQSWCHFSAKDRSKGSHHICCEDNNPTYCGSWGFAQQALVHHQLISVALLSHSFSHTHTHSCSAHTHTHACFLSLFTSAFMDFFHLCETTFLPSAPAFRSLLLNACSSSSLTFM